MNLKMCFRDFEPRFSFQFLSSLECERDKICGLVFVCLENIRQIEKIVYLLHGTIYFFSRGHD